jgi:hypothetical protein
VRIRGDDLEPISENILVKAVKPFSRQNDSSVFRAHFDYISVPIYLNMDSFAPHTWPNPSYVDEVIPKYLIASNQD